MMRPAFTPKTPDEIEDYGVNWDQVLKDGVTISSSSWSVPAGLTRVTDNIDGQSTVIRLSGGTADASYTLVNNIVTSAGEAVQEAVALRVRTAAQIAGITA